MFLLFKLFGIVFLLIQCESEAWVVDDYGCRTPDRGVGDCKPVKHCRTMTYFLENAMQPFSQNVREALSAYICSFKYGITWVCCPQAPITIIDKTNTPPPPTDIETPPDVSQHKNLKLLPEECGLVYSGDKIREGENAQLNEFPWMALLSYRTSNGREFMCGGTVINEKYILTAAHCIVNLTYPLLGVRVGEYDTSTEEDCVTNRFGSKKCIGPVQNIAIEEIIPHPKYQRDTIQNDIGLLRLSGINLNANNVKPICLPVDEELANAKFPIATVTGWGITDPRIGKSSKILQKVDLSVVDQEDCINVYRYKTSAQVTNRNICAGGSDAKDSCKGDSGGPLQVAAFVNEATRYIQQGVVSYGHITCGENGYPAVYTKVSLFMDWILDSMRP